MTGQRHRSLKKFFASVFRRGRWKHWGKRGKPPDTQLLDRLLYVSGLPLEDLQFLAAAGLLNTCLHRMNGEGYTLEAWSVALTALCGRPIRLENAGEVERWLATLGPGFPANPYSPNSDGEFPQLSPYPNPAKPIPQTNQIMEGPR